jgi:ABC-type antimicrobial peptide transport system permease subunit
MFTFPFLKGDPRTALTDPQSLILVRSVAEKYFGHDSPVGKVLNVNNEQDFTVVGVLEDIPASSTIKFDMLIPFNRIEDFEKAWAVLDNWSLSGFATYIQLEKEASREALENKIAYYLKKRVPESEDVLYLQPFKDIHLHSSHVQFSMEGQGDIAYVYVFSLIAFFVMVIACINFMNLATARSANRAKEVGLRKVVGAKRSQLIRQFFCESLGMAFLALILALVIVEAFLPTFAGLSGKALVLNFSSHIHIVLVILLMTALAGFLSGTYPALFLSSLRPVRVLKGTLRIHGRGIYFRQILVVAQFSLSILLIICTIVVSRQIGYIQNKKLGLDKEHMVYLPLREGLADRYETLKTELIEQAGIKNVTVSSSLPTSGVFLTTDKVSWEGKTPGENILLEVTSTGYDFIETFDMQVIEGRSFSEKYLTDEEQAIMINETAKNIIGMEDPVGKQLLFGDAPTTIIGVVKDYHFKSLHTEIEPLIMAIVPSLFRYVFVKLEPTNIPAALAGIESAWEVHFPDTPFEYHFLDEAYEKLYLSENRMGILFNYFTSLAILISCMGLFGLASFMAEKRTKEIGIRKVLGASLSGIVLLLNTQFTKWVLLANILAWPVAYYAMTKWLRGFAFRIDLGIGVFLSAAVMALAIAVLTVSYQSIKAAVSNPAEALRYE